MVNNKFFTFWNWFFEHDVFGLIYCGRRRNYIETDRVYSVIRSMQIWNSLFKYSSTSINSVKGFISQIVKQVFLFDHTFTTSICVWYIVFFKAIVHFANLISKVWLERYPKNSHDWYAMTNFPSLGVYKWRFSAKWLLICWVINIVTEDKGKVDITNVHRLFLSWANWSHRWSAVFG